MDNLVLCPCGHAGGIHSDDGCLGGRFRPCACRLDRPRAIDAAIAAAATRPWQDRHVESAGECADESVAS